MKVASININGLKNRKSDLIKVILENSIDVTLIQEIHKIDSLDAHDLLF